MLQAPLCDVHVIYSEIFPCDEKVIFYIRYCEYYIYFALLLDKNAQYVDLVIILLNYNFNTVNYAMECIKCFPLNQLHNLYNYYFSMYMYVHKNKPNSLLNQILKNSCSPSAHKRRVKL